ncbi:MAG: Smr/MutS family protein [Candidatus Magasanikbacteria bacterium]|nr:Smr/MutS family protein [Candidatus Magasanikbacteria bacterium]
MYMNDNDIHVALFGASINPRLPVIDLHAAPDVHTAMEKFDRDFDRLLRSGARAGRIIYGLGEGVLAREIHKRLKTNQQILGWQEEESGGSCVVLF